MTNHPNRSRMHPKHKGGLAELRAAAWLLEQGYEVFRNVSQCGLIDIVAMRDGQFEYFDVKTASQGVTTLGKAYKPDSEAARIGLKIIAVFSATRCEIWPIRIETERRNPISIAKRERNTFTLTEMGELIKAARS